MKKYIINLSSVVPKLFSQQCPFVGLSLSKVTSCDYHNEHDNDNFIAVHSLRTTALDNRFWLYYKYYILLSNAKILKKKTQLLTIKVPYILFLIIIIIIICLSILEFRL